MPWPFELQPLLQGTLTFPLGLMFVLSQPPFLPSFLLGHLLVLFVCLFFNSYRDILQYRIQYRVLNSLADNLSWAFLPSLGHLASPLSVINTWNPLNLTTPTGSLLFLWAVRHSENANLLHYKLITLEITSSEIMLYYFFSFPKWIPYFFSFPYIS